MGLRRPKAMLRELIIGLVFAMSIASHAVASDDAAVQSQRELIANVSAPNEKVEFFWSKPAGRGPLPIIIFLHGHQEPSSGRIGGKAFVNWGALDDYSKAGFVAVSVSQPGYGGSEGRPDFCGPRTQAAVKTVIDHFRASKFVDTRKVAVEGISRGAVVASMLAAHDPDLRAIVLIGGLYDLQGFYNGQCLGSKSKTAVADSICASIRVEMPEGREEFGNRSALNSAPGIKASVLILHGAQDANSPVEQAQAFYDALRKAGANVEIHVFPEANHQVPLKERKPIINAFLKRALGLTQQLPQ